MEGRRPSAPRSAGAMARRQSRDEGTGRAGELTCPPAGRRQCACACGCDGVRELRAGVEAGPGAVAERRL